MTRQCRRDPGPEDRDSLFGWATVPHWTPVTERTKIAERQAECGAPQFQWGEDLRPDFISRQTETQMSSSETWPAGAEAPDGGTRAGHVESAGGKARALMVEDDINTRFALSVLLERAGIDVVTVSNGAAALQTLKHTHDIDIVLMPIMGGYETMTAIRHIPGFGDLPIIAVTAEAAEGERDRCLAAGESDYIPKPINAAQLIDAIAPWLPGGRDAHA
jgi:CheY-like chemotaxis protein